MKPSNKKYVQQQIPNYTHFHHFHTVCFHVGCFESDTRHEFYSIYSVFFILYRSSLTTAITIIHKFCFCFVCGNFVCIFVSCIHFTSFTYSQTYAHITFVSIRFNSLVVCFIYTLLISIYPPFSPCQISVMDNEMQTQTQYTCSNKQKAKQTTSAQQQKTIRAY